MTWTSTIWDIDDYTRDNLLESIYEFQQSLPEDGIGGIDRHFLNIFAWDTDWFEGDLLPKCKELCGWTWDGDEREWVKDKIERTHYSKLSIMIDWNRVEVHNMAPEDKGINNDMR